MAIIDLFQCDPWCHPTQNWLKNATNDISIHEFHNVTRHYQLLRFQDQLLRFQDQLLRFQVNNTLEINKFLTFDKHSTF
jgi:hypothetical protein